MPLVAIGAVTLRHWIGRSLRSRHEARADGHCLHAEVFPVNALLFSMTQWRDAILSQGEAFALWKATAPRARRA